MAEPKRRDWGDKARGVEPGKGSGENDAAVADPYSGGGRRQNKAAKTRPRKCGHKTEAAERGQGNGRSRTAAAVPRPRIRGTTEAEIVEVGTPETWMAKASPQRGRVRDKAA